MSKSDRPESPVAASGEEIPVTPGIEEKIHQFWERNHKLILALCAVVVLFILVKGVMKYMAAEALSGVQDDYSVAVTPEQLKQFANENEGHGLAAIAWVRVGDAAYAEGRGEEALEAYRQAESVLDDGPLADRVALGLAMSQFMVGQRTEAESALETLMDSDDVTGGVRVEASYHLASLAHERGDSDKVAECIGQIMQIDPSSPWAQRVNSFRSVEVAAEQTAIAPAVTDTAPEEESADSVIKLNLSGEE